VDFISNIGIDLFCGGLRSFNVKILQNLVLPTGGILFSTHSLNSIVLNDRRHLSQGALILFREFDAIQLSRNFAVALNRWTGIVSVYINMMCQPFLNDIVFFFR